MLPLSEATVPVKLTALTVVVEKMLLAKILAALVMDPVAETMPVVLKLPPCILPVTLTVVPV